VIGQIGGLTEAVTAEGNYAYVGIGMRMVVVDISNPSTPVEVGSTVPLAASVSEITVVGSTAYVADGAGGLYIIGVSDVANPTVLGRWVTNGYAEEVAVSGQFALVADGPAGLAVVDVSTPSKPVEIGSAYPLDYAFGVAVSGAYAYIAAGSVGLLVANVANPARPSDAGSMGTSGYLYGVTVSGAIAYLADGWGGVQIANVSNPARPALVGTAHTDGWAVGVEVSDGTVYAACETSMLCVVDASNPAQPKEAYYAALWGRPFGVTASLALDGNLVLLADQQNGLRILDISKGLDQAGLFNEMGLAGRVGASGDYAYVVGNGNLGLSGLPLSVVDFANPGSPAVTQVASPGGGYSDIVVNGTLMYLANWDSVQVFDISSPTKPELLSSVSQPMGPVNIVVKRGVLYETGEFNFTMFDVSNPKAISLLGYYDFTKGGGRVSGIGSAHSVSVSGGVAYVDDSGALYAMNISDPAKPSVISEYPAWLSVAPWVSVIKGNYLFVGGYGGLDVVDISNPSNLKLISGVSPPGDIEDLALVGNTLYAASGAGGLQVIDISNPASPVITASVSLSGTASGVAVSSGRVYVGDGDGGLFAIDLPNQASPGLANGAQPVLGTAYGSSPQPPLQVLQSAQASQPAAPPLQAGSGAVLTVNTTADAGPGSLRWALGAARDGDRIVFDKGVFPPGSPATIMPLTPLPYITQGSLLLDGSGAGVIINGSREQAGSGGIILASNYNTVEGLQVVGFPTVGIGIVNASYNTVGGNRTQGQGNVVSDNGGAGIGIAPCLEGTYNDLANCNGNTPTSFNTIVGNYVGTDASGEHALGSQGTGIWLGKQTSYTTIGGVSPGFRNVVSNNVRAGISQISSNYNTIVGNYIGTDAAGEAALGNKNWGLSLEGSSGDNVTGNLISGNGGDGFIIADAPSSHNIFRANLIGTDATGTKAIGNAIGAELGQPYNIIGGPNPGDGNVFTGNTNINVVVAGNGLLLEGNCIGTDASCTKALGSANADIWMKKGAFDNIIGGVGAGDGNVIAGGFYGVDVDTSSYNSFIGNFIGSDRAGNPIPQESIGVGFLSSAFNYVDLNRISGSNGSGISIDSLSSNNTVFANTVSMNTNYGIAVGGSYNTIASNNFESNGVSGQDSGAGNKWDLAGIGNYWSSYAGTDRGDGIGSTPFAVPPNGWDNYPLMKLNGGLTTVWLTVESNIPNTSFTVGGTKSNAGASGTSVPLGYFQIYNVTVPQFVLTPDGMKATFVSLNGMPASSELLRLYENQTLQVTYSIQNSTTTTTTTTSTVTPPTTTTTTQSTSSSTTTSTTAPPLSTSTSGATSSSSSSGGIPEFPYELGALAALVGAMAISYLLVRRRRA
jgi:parallel beta-helix repeat protein